MVGLVTLVHGSPGGHPRGEEHRGHEAHQCPPLPHPRQQHPHREQTDDGAIDHPTDHYRSLQHAGQVPGQERERESLAPDQEGDSIADNAKDEGEYFSEQGLLIVPHALPEVAWYEVSQGHGGEGVQAGAEGAPCIRRGV